MGIIAESFVAYAQPLLDQTGGSVDEMNRALALSQTCWSLALLPEEEQNEAIVEMQAILKMDDDEFDAFRQSVLIPMIRRHREMFPLMHRPGSRELPGGTPASQTRPKTPVRVEKYPGTGRNAPCPCNSGRKYKRCCGR